MAVIEQVPVPDRTCSWSLTIEQAVEAPASKVTAPEPEPPVVVIGWSGAPKVALVGAVMTRVAWFALLMATVNAAEVVGLKFASPALVAVIEQVPVPETT